MPGQRGQPADTPVVQCQAVSGDRELEVGVRRDNPKVTNHGQLHAGPDGRAVDGTDDRNRDGVDRLVERDRLFREVGCEHVAGEIGAGTENRARTGQHDCPRLVGGGLFHSLPQRVGEFSVQRITPLRSLQLDRRHIADAFDTNHGIQAYWPAGGGYRPANFSA